MKKTILQLIKSDLIQARILKKEDKLNFLKFLFYFCKSKTCRVQTFIRLRATNNILSYLSKKYLDGLFIEIGKNTIIDEYFFLPHPRCIIIANNVQIGKHVHIGQYVTIGGNLKKTRELTTGIIQKMPIIGDRVMINPGSVVGGPVKIGSDVILGANSVITKDVDSNSIAFSQNKIANKKITLSSECELIKEKQ